jgi:hypothetical protein
MIEDAPTDWNFFYGNWKVKHRRLKKRLSADTNWETFDGTCMAQPILGGFGNIEDNVLLLPAGTYRAFCVRSYDVETGTWAIWWLDRRNPHAIDVPVIGEFKDGVGKFLADDTYDGRPIKVQYLWTRIDTPSPRWEQAFSADGGAAWETNWTMDFHRE